MTLKVIAVIRMSDEKKVFKVIEALERGGVKALEITMTTPGALGIIAFLSREKTQGILVGAGTVLNLKTAMEAIRAGADFLVSPVANFDMIRVCREENWNLLSLRAKNLMDSLV